MTKIQEQCQPNMGNGLALQDLSGGFDIACWVLTNVIVDCILLHKP